MNTTGETTTNSVWNNHQLDSRQRLQPVLKVMLSVTVFTICVWWSLPFVAICYAEVAEAWTVHDPPKIPIVIIGGYGDLAKKYLWQGIYNLHETYGGEDRSPLLMYSGGRADSEGGQKKTSDALASGVFCATGDGVCRRKKDSFVERVSYYRMTEESDFDVFCRNLTLITGGREEGRLFYLSVPPFAYGKIGRYINAYCRPPVPSDSADPKPSIVEKSWLRVVVEKPFGKDLESAEMMSKELLKHFDDEELYRIDHYMGKTTVRNILEFRHVNRGTGIESLLNRDHVDRVEVVVKETLGCKGRMNYYDDYGVVADMMQNHLTEVAIMVAMDLPNDPTDSIEVENKKLETLGAIRPLELSSTVLGQYSTYNLEAAQEATLDKSGASTSGDQVSLPRRTTSLTPTFAATAMHVDNNRWLGVPFVLMTGKKLDERIGYARIVFKENLFCVPRDANIDDALDHGPCQKRELIFHIAHGTLKRPSILASKSLPRPLAPEGWRETTNMGGNLVFGSNKGSAFNVFSSVEDEIAYSFLVRAVVRGQRDYFLSDEHLMSSWKIWSPLVKAVQKVKPRLYSQLKNNLDNLRFFYDKGGTLRFVKNFESGDHEFSKYSRAANVPHGEVTLLNSTVVLGTTTEVDSALALAVKKLARARVASSGSFHMAVPGGASPKGFLRLLVAMDDFPWKQTHVWMVDDRIVQFSHPHSNFGAISRTLQPAALSYDHLHPIPVNLAPSLEPHLIAAAYLHQIKTTVQNLAFDVVVLGLGVDGHVASLFPEDVELYFRGNLASEEVVVTRKGKPSENDDETVKQKSLSGEKSTVSTERVSNRDVPRDRVSLNYNVINAAGRVFVVAEGKGKRKIVRRLKESDRKEKLPIDLISRETLTFFVDLEAWNV